jgi:hypothetical protein
MEEGESNRLEMLPARQPKTAENENDDDDEEDWEPCVQA